MIAQHALSPEPNTVSEQPVQHRVVFTGSASEYFGIWIINAALTILTLGLYGPWAKVRREQYFHWNTYLAGHSFDYTADPWNLLKGRLLLFGFVVSFSIVGAVLPIVNLLFSAIAIAVAPFVITQALRFRARYTSYRNIPFRFRRQVPHLLHHHSTRISRDPAYELCAPRSKLWTARTVLRSAHAPLSGRELLDYWTGRPGYVRRRGREASSGCRGRGS